VYGLNESDQPYTAVNVLLRHQVPDKEREALNYVGIAEESMVKGMAFEVPKEYANLPQLLVRSKSYDLGKET
jgi:hypothetical protein